MEVRGIFFFNKKFFFNTHTHAHTHTHTHQNKVKIVTKGIEEHSENFTKGVEENSVLFHSDRLLREVGDHSGLCVYFGTEIGLF